jgi:hypothetical protein
MPTQQSTELYVTPVEHEAYDLAGQISLPPTQARSHVEERKDDNGTPLYVVMVDAPEAVERARAVMRRMLGSYTRGQIGWRDVERS